MLIENERPGSSRCVHARRRPRDRRDNSQLQEIRAVIHASRCRDVRLGRPHSLTSPRPRGFRLFRSDRCYERSANSLISRGGHRHIEGCASRWPATKPRAMMRGDVRVSRSGAAAIASSLLSSLTLLDLLANWSSLHFVSGLGSTFVRWNARGKFE